MTRFEFRVIRSGARLCNLDVLQDTAPSISWTHDAEIKRTVSLKCKIPQGVNWLTDQVQAVQITDGVEIPRGRFWITTHPRTVEDDLTESLQLTGYDLGYQVRELAKIEQSLTIPAGTVVTAAIQEQLVAAGLTRMLVTASTETLMTDHTYDAGETRYAVVQSLLAEINYRDLWFNDRGVAIVEPWAAASASNVRHHYPAGSASILTAALEEDDDTFASANVFVEIVSSADLSADMRAESINDNPTSALSVVRRGIRVPSFETLDSISSQAALQTRADNRKLMSMMGTKTITFYTGVRDDTASRGLNDSIMIDRDGIGLLEELNWSIDCSSGGLVTHTARKVYYT